MLTNTLSGKTNAQAVQLPAVRLTRSGVGFSGSLRLNQHSHPEFEMQQNLLRRRDATLDLVLRLALASAVGRTSSELSRILAQNTTQSSSRSNTPLGHLTILISFGSDLRAVFSKKHSMVARRAFRLRHSVLLWLSVSPTRYLNE